MSAPANSRSIQRKIQVSFYHRRPQGQFSVEEYFSTVRAHLPPDIEGLVAESSWFSRGLWPRIANTIEAAGRQRDVNHITGDIHYVAFGLDRRKTLLTILDCAFEQWPPGLKREVFRRLWFSWPDRRVARLTAISQFTKDRLVALLDVSPERIDVIPVCVSPDLSPRPRPFATGRPVVLQVGTKANKNLERLAQAMRGLECDLRIIGQISSAQRAVLAENDIRFSAAGRLTRQAILEEYERADLVAFASTYEGFGMPILEAQAVGRPVLTSTVTSMPDVAGDAAWLVDPYDVDAIRAGLIRLLAEPALRERLVDRGFRNVRRFAPDVVAGAYARVYREMATAVARSS